MSSLTRCPVILIICSAFAPVQPPDNKMRPPSPQCQDESKVQQENVDVENRRILTMQVSLAGRGKVSISYFQCDLEDTERKDGQLSLRILLRFEVNPDETLGMELNFVVRTT